MADHNLIPPVSGSRNIPKSHPVPAKRDQRKRQPQQKPKEPDEKKDDDRPSIDEYA